MQIPRTSYSYNFDNSFLFSYTFSSSFSLFSLSYFFIQRVVQLGVGLAGVITLGVCGILLKTMFYKKGKRARRDRGGERGEEKKRK